VHTIDVTIDDPMHMSLISHVSVDEDVSAGLDVNGDVGVVVSDRASWNYHALGTGRGELSRSWHRQGGIITLLAWAGGNYHALGIDRGELSRSWHRSGMYENSINFNNYLYAFY